MNVGDEVIITDTFAAINDWFGRTEDGLVGALGRRIIEVEQAERGFQTVKYYAGISTVKQFARALSGNRRFPETETLSISYLSAHDP